MEIRAVLFDLGDTLWHFPGFPSDEALGREYGRRLDERMAAWGQPAGRGEPLARAVMDADRVATREAMHGEGRSPDFNAMVRECASALGLALDEARAADLWDTMHIGGRFLKRTLFPDTIPLLQELRRRGYAIGSVTNRSFGGRRFFEEMQELGLMELFDAWSVSADEGWLKPHRALFDKALEILGVEATQAVMVGDDLRADVYGARLLGMPSVWKRPPHRTETPVRGPDGAEVLPDYTIDHPGELLELEPFRR